MIAHTLDLSNQRDFIIIWNIERDAVLTLPGLPSGVDILAYADDLIVLVKARQEEELELRANDALEMVSEWMTQHHLQLPPPSVKPSSSQEGRRLGTYS